jgi:ankyrin repeat protein
MNTELFNKLRITSFISSGLLILWFYVDDFSKVKVFSDLGINTPKAISTVLVGLIAFCTIECLVELSKIKDKSWQYYYQTSTLIGVALISTIIAYPKIADTFLLLGTSRFDIIIPLSFAFLASIFSSILSEFLIVTKVFITLRKTILIDQLITFIVLVSLLAMSISAIYYVDAISNSISLIVRNVIFAIFFVAFLLAQSPKKPIFSKERLEWLKKKSDSLDHQVEVNKLFSEENLVHPKKKLLKNIRRQIKGDYERKNNSVFPRYITLKKIPFEIKKGCLYPVKDVLDNDDFVIEVKVIDRTDETILRSDKIMFKYVVMACEQTPIKAPKNKDANFIALIAENAWELQMLNENDPNEFIVGMAQSDESLPELKAVFKNKKIDVNFVAPNGWTALLSSVANGADETTKYLLQKAADPSLSNKHDISPLHFASKYGNISLCKLLIDYKASINQLDIWGATPLMMAAKYGHSGIVKLLIENNANAKIKDTENETAYTYAIKGNYGDIARYIKENNMGEVLE